MRKYLLIILFLSIGVHFVFFGNPNETVFDEVHFGKFISAYYTGEYYFDIHPPLGKLMIAGFSKLFNFQPEFSFVNIGDQFPDKKYLILRFLPTLAGTLLPVVIFLLALQFGISRIGAFAAGLLIIFDNALLTQSRLILLDPFLLLFGFASLLFYFRHRNRNKNQDKRNYSQILPPSHKAADGHGKNLRIVSNANLILMAVFAGLAISIKWTGLSFIVLPILIESAKILKIRRTNIKQAIAYFMSVLRLTSFFFISLAIYFSVFVLHFTFLPNPGPGDAFMKPNFRENSIVKNISDLNVEMYKSNQRLSASHPYSSQWYTWPLMTRPIYYWVKDTARIYFFDNPIVWWSSTIAVAISLWLMAYGLWLKIKKYSKPSSIVYSPLAFLLGGYFLNLLPFIGIKRVMFLYHYLIPLIFAILILVYLVDPEVENRAGFAKDKLDSHFRAGKTKKQLLAGLVIASIAAFIYFAPLSYGLPLSEKAYNARIWFASWR